MPLMPVPISGVKISSKQAADTNGIRESFLSLDLFSLTFKNILLAVLRGAIAPIAFCGSVTVCEQMAVYRQASCIAVLGDINDYLYKNEL